MNIAQDTPNRTPCFNFENCGNLASPEETLCPHCSKGTERLVEAIFKDK